MLTKIYNYVKYKKKEKNYFLPEGYQIAHDP